MFFWVAGLSLVFGLVPRGAHAVESGVDSLLPVQVSSTSSVTEAYVYTGDRFRDPFVPLSGGASGGYLRPVEDVGPFNPVGLSLKGIVAAPTGRWAVVRTKEGGTYFIKDGKIFDPKRKAVEGYQAIVQEKSIVILGPKGQEIEVGLKTSEDENPVE